MNYSLIMGNPSLFFSAIPGRLFKIIVLGLLLLQHLFVFSQEFSDKNEAIAAMKVSFITRKLNLTPKEAQNFWPLYNQYEEELEILRKNHRKMIHEAKDDFSQISEAEIEKIVDEQINFRQKEIDILKKYHPQFKKVLPMRKVAQLYKAEDEFKRHLIKQLKGK